MAKGIILAAGRGKRMDHETDDKPKCLTKLLGKPLIDWQIRSLHEAGIYDIAVVTGYKGDCLDSFGLHRFVNENWARTQIFESLNCAHSWLESFECIVSYSDIVYEKTAIMGLLDAMDNVAVSYDTRWLDRWSRRVVPAGSA